MRIFYNNVNGMEINELVQTIAQKKYEKNKQKVLKEMITNTKVEQLLQQMRSWSVNVMALSEPCIDWSELIPRRVVQEVSKKYNNTGCYTVATSNSKVGNFLKPGGALIYSDNEWSGRIIQKGTDPWGYGRWSFQRYSSGSEKSILIVSAYRVGKRNPESVGTTTAWYQQYTLMTSEGREGDPSEMFLQDLKTWINKTKTNETEIIILIDANEKWGPSAKITQFATQLNLHNILGTQESSETFTHPCITDPTRGTTIDYALVSQNIVEHIKFVTLTPYDLQTLGDHRGIMIDLDVKKLLHVTHTKLERTAGRKLSSDNPKYEKAYLKYVINRFKKQNIIERANKLMYQTVNNKKTPDLIMKRYEALDTEIFHICTKAERRCRKTNPTNAQWSPSLVKALNALKYWYMRLKHNKSHPTIVKLGADAEIQYQEYTKEEILYKIKRSKDKLAETRKNSVQIRKRHLEDMAEKYEKLHNLSKAQAIQEILTHEEIRLMFSIMKEKLKGTPSGQLSSLWVATDDNGDYVKDPSNVRIIKAKSQIEKLLLERNAKHLAQAKNTPFAKIRLRRKLKWDGTGKFADDILTGDALNQNRYKETLQLYLESFRMNKLSDMNVVKPSLSLDEYREFIKKKREKTATSPFGLHLGHFKAALQKNPVLNVHRIMLLIPFVISRVPIRWRKTVQTMLQKEPKAPWIHRLRIIELFDAQVNAGFQIFIGRRMIRTAVDGGQLHEASYGSTPGQMATSAILQKILVMDQLRVERRAGGIFDCDATGCYDRILPPLASVHLRHLGLSKSISTFLAKMMHYTRRYVKTKHGISKNSIKTTNRQILHGIGQGNGGGPAIWLAHLTIMFKAISAICTGAELESITGKVEITTVGTG